MKKILAAIAVVVGAVALYVRMFRRSRPLRRSLLMKTMHGAGLSRRQMPSSDGLRRGSGI